MVQLQPDDIEFSGQEEGEDESPLPILSQGERRVYAEKSDPTIEGLYKSFQRGQLDLQPEFQRGYVWDDAKASRLIESVLLDVPIPNVYLAEEQDGKRSVIDGQQRLTSFFRAFQPIPLGRDLQAPKLRLRGLRILTDLNSKPFEDWGEQHQAKFEQAALRVVTIQKESNPEVKYEIFERLNTGSMGLNDQELRNCIYRGPYNSLLHDLSEDADFQNLVGLKEPARRMQDIELVLRFFAFQRSTYLNYRSPMKGFLNKEMNEKRSLSQADASKLRTSFRDAVATVKLVFGDHAFRRFVPGNDNNPNGQYERPVNKALFDIIMWGFSQYPRPQVVPYADAIREELLWLMSRDQEFIDSIMIGTNDASKIRTRFDKWRENLKLIMGQPHQEQRLFKTSDKELLYNAPGGHGCRDCGQQILSLDDAEVDHIEHYWRGGKTELRNARLLHRYCNRKRGGRD